MIKRVDFPTAKGILDSRPEAVLLDVREEDEYLSGHAAGSALLPVGRINADSAARVLSPSAPVLVYCRTGFRSRKAAVKLERLGYQEVYDIGSLAGWPYGISYGID